MEFYEILCGIATIIFAFYYFFKSTFNFWKSRGVPGPRPIPGFGNISNIIFMKIPSDFIIQVYNDYKDDPLIGIFARRTPILIVKNLDLIKDILIKNFSNFADRGLSCHEKIDPLSQNLFFLEPKRWRSLRMKLSPVFTSAKLKGMFSYISECADHFVQYLEEVASIGEPVDCRELTAKYTTDVIGNCVFGIEMNALSNNGSKFHRMGKETFNPSVMNMLRYRIRESFPQLYNIFGCILPQTKISKFFLRVIMENMNHREVNNITRNDFVDILRELKKHPNKLSDIDLTDSLIASQAFVFFVAGYETSSSAISNALYELALNEKIQDSLRKEIDEIYAKHDGDLTYENIKKMNYLDKVFKETLRKYSPLTCLMRRSTSSYTFDSIGVSIPKDQKIWIPIYAIHRDPKFYPKPDVFDPERFSDKAVQSRHPMSYLPFGDGPRNCIGTQFAVYQSKIGLIKILRNYKIEICEKTPISYINDPKAFLLAPKDGLHLKIIKIDRT